MSDGERRDPTWRRLGLAGLALLMAAIPAIAETTGLPVVGTTWLEVSTPAFTLTSQLPEDETSNLATELEGFQTALRLLAPARSDESPVLVRVFAFGSESEYRPYRRAAGGDSPATTGHFFAHRFGIYLLLDADTADGDPLPSLYHEYLHAFLDNTFGHLPLWLEEGMAEYFSTFTGDRNTLTLGLPHADHIAWLRANPSIPLAQLFAIDSESSEYDEGTRRGGFHAQSWLLVHYLLSGDPEQRSAAAGFLEGVSRGEDPQKALAASLDLDFPRLEKTLAGYAESRSLPTRRIPAGPVGPAAAVNPVAIDPAVAVSRLGTYLALAGADALASQHLLATVDSQPDAEAGLGLLALRSGDSEAALTHYRRSSTAGASDPLSYALFADLLLAGPADSQRLSEARTALNRAVALDPSFAEAHAMLGVAGLTDPGADGTTTVQHLETALGLLPGRTDIAYYLGVALLQTGRREEAHTIYRRHLVRSGDEEYASALATALGKDTAADRINRAIDSGDLEAIRDALEAAIEITAEPALRRELESRLAQAERRLEVDDLVSRYKASVALANDGHWNTAQDELEGLQPEVETLLLGTGAPGGELPADVMTTVRALEPAISNMLAQLEDALEHDTEFVVVPPDFVE